MVKIKQKKIMSLPQLIEWAWDNPEQSRNKRFVSENKEFPYVNQYVIFNEVGYAEIENRYCYGRNDLVTVEIEEDITEHSIFNELVGLREDDSYWKYEDASIYAFNKEIIKAIYIPNDDFTMTLIWTKEKGLVE